MTGLEGPALTAAGGRLLGGLAFSATKAIANRLTFKFRVWRRIKKRVDYKVPRAPFARWLKSLTADELGSAVEEVCAALAVRLDSKLSDGANSWDTSPDHLSRALELVELSYPAIAAELGDADAAELAASWAQHRSAVVRDLLLQIAGPVAALSRDDFAQALMKRSDARRYVRLLAFEVEESRVGGCLDRITPPDFASGRLKVLVGGFGSGKSEKAENWHRSGIRELLQQDVAPYPAWMSARNVGAQQLEEALDQQIGNSWRAGRGAEVVVDGLDETTPATAHGLLEDARVLVHSFPNLRILMTARPGVLIPLDDEAINMEPLSEEDALALIESAGGERRQTWTWTTNMRTTVRRPFFALAVGAMARREQLPRGEADLIRNLVERSLARGSERSAVIVAANRANLELLAVSLTRRDRDELSFSERQVALSSRLVSEEVDGSLSFSLPIFQQWFAAQAILNGNVLASEVVADADSFGRWRWAAAIAALSASSVEVVDELISEWVGGNPGAGSWILQQAFAGHRDWRTESDDLLDARTSGLRLLTALRDWASALGNFADGVLPEPVTRGPVGLGVVVSGHRINVAFATTPPTEDRVFEVPAGVHPLAPRAVPNWQPWITGAVPQGDAWPWTFVQKRIAASTLNRLECDRYLGHQNGIWAQERRFAVARALWDRGSSFNGILEGAGTKKLALALLGKAGGDPRAGFSLNGSATFSGRDLLDLTAFLDKTGSDEIVSGLPDSDIASPTGGWVWDLYSQSGLMRFESEVYGRACEAFDEATSTQLRNFSWSLPTSCLAPFGALMEIEFEGSRRSGNAPVFSVIRVPMELLASMAPSDPSAVWSSTRRAVITQVEAGKSNDWQKYESRMELIRSWLAARNLEPLGGIGWSSTGADDMSKSRPASNLAANWIFDDLKSVGLGSGTFPQLK